MTKFFMLLLVQCLFIQCTTLKQTPTKNYNEGVHIIPMPNKMTKGEKTFSLNRSTKIVVTHENEILGKHLQDKIKTATGMLLELSTKLPETNYINLKYSSSIIGDEAYHLKATPEQISLQASTPKGLFYAIQTFFQLLPAEIESTSKVKEMNWTIPEIDIEDAPRFKHRGVMIDVCRHFFEVDDIKRQIDIMSMLKLNVLHLHLTDHQAWRIEIKKYPKLIEVGAVGDMGNGKTYGPYYYTQEEIKEIVAYAKDHYIEVIPEIEFPGHCLAALAAYPNLSCTGGPFKLKLIFGYEVECFCVGKEETFTFMQNVLREVSALFPSKYIHIGGDECDKKRWSECPLCQAKAQELGLKKTNRHSVEEQLQSYAIKRMERFVSQSLKKQMIGWDEILEGGLAPGAVVMSWRGTQGGIKAAESGHDVIMAPMVNGFYLCDGQGAHEVEPATSGRIALLKQLYQNNPIPEKLSKEQQKHILGTEVCLWSEWVVSPSLAEYMLYPRVMAASEINWSHLTQKDWTDFQRRLSNMLVRLDLKGINYHIPIPEGVLTQNVAFTGDSVVLKFTNTRSLPMVYTENNAKLTANDATITNEDSLVIRNTRQLQIATVLPSGKLSKIRTLQVQKEQPLPMKHTTYDARIRLRIADGYFYSDKDYVKAQFHTDTIINSFAAYNNRKYTIEQPQLAIYEGQIKLPETGVYTFSTNVDELWIDGQRLIYNETASRFYAKKHQIALQKGVHEFKLTYNNTVKEGFASCWKEIDFIYQLPSGGRYIKR